mmetsp:Transcript_96564/g.278757  ORF Transcript_96564/g.278757 Transcript_96564/m.278757 type:complete len:288 (-) Transcript_96564:651-1514(-)
MPKTRRSSRAIKAGSACSIQRLRIADGSAAIAAEERRPARRCRHGLGVRTRTDAQYFAALCRARPLRFLVGSNSWNFATSSAGPATLRLSSRSAVRRGVRRQRASMLWGTSLGSAVCSAVVWTSSWAVYLAPQSDCNDGVRLMGVSLFDGPLFAMRSATEADGCWHPRSNWSCGSSQAWTLPIAIAACEAKTCTNCKSSVVKSSGGVFRTSDKKALRAHLLINCTTPMTRPLFTFNGTHMMLRVRKPVFASIHWLNRASEYASWITMGSPLKATWPAMPFVTGTEMT